MPRSTLRSSPTANVQAFFAPRVRSAHEMRPGYEKVGCPECNQDCWLSPLHLRQLALGATFRCRECMRGL